MTTRPQSTYDRLSRAAAASRPTPYLSLRNPPPGASSLSGCASGACGAVADYVQAVQDAKVAAMLAPAAPAAAPAATAPAAPAAAPAAPAAPAALTPSQRAQVAGVLGAPQLTLGERTQLQAVLGSPNLTAERRAQISAMLGAPALPPASRPRRFAVDPSVAARALRPKYTTNRLECPEGTYYNHPTNTCECVPPKVFDTNWDCVTPRINLSAATGRALRPGMKRTLGSTPGNTVGISSSNPDGGDLGDDCLVDDDCNSGNCVWGYCVPGLNTINPITLFCGTNAHAEGTDCVCDVGTVWIGGECLKYDDSAKIFCGQTGGTWNDAEGCQCPSGYIRDVRNGGCIDAKMNCFDPGTGNVYEDNTPCQIADSPGRCMAGECTVHCIDELGNEGTWGKDECIGFSCGQGQGRGEVSGACRVCGDYGFHSDGIRCRTCPKGLFYQASTDTCECDPPTVFDADWNCVNPATGVVTKAPVTPTCAPDEVLAGSKCVPKTAPSAKLKCDPATQVEATDESGKPYCKAKDAKPASVGGAKKSDNTLLYGVLAVAAAGGLALALTSGKAKNPRARK